MKRLSKAGISYVGAGFSKKEALSPRVITVGDAKIAFLAFTNLGSKNWQAGENSSGIDWLDQENIKAGIAEAKTKADLVVVMFHLGEEYKTSSNAEQKKFARLAVDLGADLVVGHHPHVAQEVEKYKGKYIAYSLGNFVFDQDFSKETMEGLALEVSVKNKAIQLVEARKLELNSFYQPRISE
jgi:poly-gamma-glutamate synthesis protein (capsule biosynthesis protein)